jgi:hypothetical protein
LRIRSSPKQRYSCLVTVPNSLMEAADP